MNSYDLKIQFSSSSYLCRTRHAVTTPEVIAKALLEEATQLPQIETLTFTLKTTKNTK